MSRPTLLPVAGGGLLLALLSGGCRQDMHNQPRYEPLQPSTFFADGRSSRPLVEGTVARGHFHEDTAKFTGRRTAGNRGLGGMPTGSNAGQGAGGTGQLSGGGLGSGTGATGLGGVGGQQIGGGAVRPVGAGQVAKPVAGQSGATFDADLVTEFPYPVTRPIVERGRDRYNVFCAPCHGYSGGGNGMIVQRGLTPPPSYHMDRLREAPVGHYFDVITNGYGSMYAYASRIPVEDRWAIIAYIRALQLSQNAKPEDVPADRRAALDANRPAEGQTGRMAPIHPIHPNREQSQGHSPNGGEKP